MKKLNENLSNIFGVRPLEEGESSLVEIIPSEVDSDFEFARNNIRLLAEKGQVAVDHIIQVAKATDHPRAYEVVATLIKSMSEVNKDLIELQKRKKDLSPIKEQTIVNVDKAVFVGSTRELINQIKQVQ
jgi:hypothetical protein